MQYKVGLSSSSKKPKRRKKPVKRNPSTIKYKSSRKSVSSKSRSKFSSMKFGKMKRISKYTNKNKARSTTKGGKKKKYLIKNPKLRANIQKALYILSGVLVFLGLIALISLGIFLKNLQETLPDPGKLVERTSDQSTQILDRDGKLLYRIYGDENREFFEASDIPDHTKWALLAAEDVEFYTHKGIDIPGMIRSVYFFLRDGYASGSGSTLTQQLVKNTILTDLLGAEEAREQTIVRKIKEILVTLKVEQEFTKDEILQMYMNEIPLGGVNYGFQAAAKAYFDKDIQDLTLAESAMLTGIIPAPGVYSPLFGISPEQAEEQQDRVLDNMLKYKEFTGVTEEEIEAAREEVLVYKTPEVDIPAPHFVFYVRSLLEEEYGVDVVATGGLKVTTTLDQSIQNIAEEELIKGVAQYGNKWGVYNGSMVAIDPNNGEIIAMVGSIDYNNVEDPRVDGNVNITISPRQMGSSVKPYTYLTAFAKGYGPWLLTPDIAELKFGGYEPMNWDDKFSGLMVAREALVKSRNIPAIYTLQTVGLDAFFETSEKLGITTYTDRSRYGLEVTLGSGEMKLLEHAGAFGVFANEGIKMDQVAILKVEDGGGEVLFEQEPQKGKRVFDETEIYALNWALCDLGGFKDQPFYNSYTMDGKRSFCGKTGTTNGPRDLVAMMYHKNLVVGVWAGNNNNVETPGAWSTTVPLPIASSFMQRVAGKYTPELYTRPTGINATSVCNDTGATPSKDSTCKKVSSIYISGRAPQLDKRTAIQICKSNNLLPTNKTLAEKYGLLETAIVLSHTLENIFQQSAYQKYLSARDGSNYLFKMPEEGYCELPLGPGDTPVIEITSPAAATEYGIEDIINITVDVIVKESVDSVVYEFDGIVFDTVYGSPYSTSYEVPVGTVSGSHTIKAIVTDNLGKVSSSTVIVNVDDGSAVSISITSPSNGTVVNSFPTTFTASVSTEATKVTFSVVANDGTYSTSLLDNTSDDGWFGIWNDVTATDGMYTITATAKIDGTDYTSSPIQVLLSL